MTTHHTCARCGVADADVIALQGGKIYWHQSPSDQCVAALQRQSESRRVLLGRCMPRLESMAGNYRISYSMEAASALLTEIQEAVK